jgi:hypothetical protein
MAKTRGAGRSATARKATGLLEQWTLLAGQHVPAGTGCSCGHGGAGVRLENFEQDILDYLRHRHRDAEGVQASLDERRSIPALLGALAQGDGAGLGDAATAVLADLARSLDSFGELHHRH